MKPDDLLKNEGYLLKNIQLDLFDAISKYLENNHLTQTDFAKQLGVSKGYISQILRGRFDHKLSKLVELSVAIGKVPIFRLEDVLVFIAEPLSNEILELKQIEVLESHLENNDYNKNELTYTQNIDLNKQSFQHGFTGYKQTVSIPS